MVEALRYGLVGYGLNALGHKSELKNHPSLIGRTRWIVGFDPDPNANQMLNKIKGIKVAKSFEDLLDTADLDAIIISSPPQYHADQAVAALEAGLHVFSEVPMAINEKKIKKIINAEENSGKVYQLGENYCFYSEVLFAGHLASSGKIGPIVYSESEYLHDVTYRWREGNFGDVNTPRIDSWYQLFDPLMYAHTIGPAQVALGGIKKPMPFVEVISYANDIGGYQANPICRPAKAFQVGLFKSETGAIAKCANAYIFAREPSRLIIQVTGRLGTYECYQIGKPGRLFLTDGNKIGKSRHRKGKSKIVDNNELSTIIPPVEGLYYGSSVRIMEDWLQAINNKNLLVLEGNL
jgi:predicted dehydrogenase